LWGLPGGKPEANEYVHEAVVREVFEETGLECIFLGVRGLVSELVMDSEGSTRHHVLLVCDLAVADETTPQKGEARWVSVDEVHSLSLPLIPCDWAILRNVLRTSDFFYGRCLVRRDEDSYVLEEAQIKRQSGGWLTISGTGHSQEPETKLG